MCVFVDFSIICLTKILPLVINYFRNFIQALLEKKLLSVSPWKTILCFRKKIKIWYTKIHVLSFYWIRRVLVHKLGCQLNFLFCWRTNWWRFWVCNSKSDLKTYKKISKVEKKSCLSKHTKQQHTRSDASKWST